METNLGSATTEELLREVIVRFSTPKQFHNAITIAELLGSLHLADKIYRTEAEPEHIPVKIPQASELQTERMSKILRAIGEYGPSTVKQILEQIGESTDQANISRWFHSIRKLTDAGILRQAGRNGGNKPLYDFTEEVLNT